MNEKHPNKSLLALVKKPAQPNDIIVSKHARKRMRERGVAPQHLAIALTHGEACESKRTDRVKVRFGGFQALAAESSANPPPRALISQALGTTLVIDSDGTTIVTTYNRSKK